MYTTLSFRPDETDTLESHMNEENRHFQKGNESNQSSIMEEKPISNGLSLTYEELLEKYKRLEQITTIQQKLIAKFMKGNSINSIVKELYTLTGFPGVIYNVHGHSIASAGGEIFSKGLSPSVLFQYIPSRYVYASTESIQTIQRNDDRFYLVSKAFFINEKKAGYCCIFFEEDHEPDMEYALQLIGKVAIVCSLVFLHEKTKIDATEHMKGLFLKEIITGQFTSEDEIIAKAGLFQFDLRQPYYICFLGYQYDENNFQSEDIFSREIIQCIKFFNQQQNAQMLINHEGHHIYLIVNKHFNNNQEKQQYFSLLINYLSTHFPGSHFYMGISRRKNTVLKAQDAYKEAMVAKRIITSHNQVIFYESLGMIGTLLNQQNEHEVRKMAKSLLSNLDYNNQKDHDMVKTLYFFLVNGGNLEKTAEELSLSISGLRYRVQKMEELLQKDIRNPVNSCQLLMAIQGLILLGDLNINNILEN